MIKKLSPFLITLFLGLLYLRTLAPGLTWAYDGADGGDLLAALATGGVPHPGGYPTYLLFASLYAELPLGSLAFRANLFSGFCMLLAAFALYHLVLALTNSSYVAGISSLLFGTFPLVWSQALITEVYALQALLSVLVLFFFVPQRVSAWRDIAGGLALGLALGNHLTAIFLFPFLLLQNARQNTSAQGTADLRALSKPYFQNLARRLLGLCLGLGVFLTIPVRARNQAPVNWGNAVDWDGFWWLVSGAMYRGRLGHYSLDYLLAGVRLWSRFLLDQMGIVGLSIALLYIVVFFRPSRLHLMTIWLALIYSLFAIVYYSPDTYVYLILPLLAFAVWIGLGCEYLIRKLPTKITFLKPLAITASIAFVIVNAFWLIPSIDISTDRRAEEFAQTTLNTVPENAIIVARGDEPTFALWYFQYAAGQRPDVAIVANDLSVQSWYRGVLTTTYPGLNVPDKLSVQSLMEFNPQRPVCVLGTDLKPQFECFLYSK